MVRKISVLGFCTAVCDLQFVKFRNGRMLLLICTWNKV